MAPARGPGGRRRARRMPVLVMLGLLGVLVLGGVSACTGGQPGGGPTPEAGDTTGAGPGATGGARREIYGDAPAVSGGEANVRRWSQEDQEPPPWVTEPMPPQPDPVSIPALVDRRFDGEALAVGRVLDRDSDWTAYEATYSSDGHTISAELTVPRGAGPFPAVVTAHGYVDPAVYTTGQGLSREQDWLASAGYVVLHPDYRGYAGSDDVRGTEVGLRLGYTADVVNAVQALRAATLSQVDGTRIGLLGRSMGGGVVLNALEVRPGLVSAAVLYAPVSSRVRDDVRRWIVADPKRAGLARRIFRAHGTFRESPAFWRQVSPRTYLSRITEPVLVQHGTADPTCPLRWSEQTVAAMEQAGVDARLVTWPGEGHELHDAFAPSMRLTTRFLDQHL